MRTLSEYIVMAGVAGPALYFISEYLEKSFSALDPLITVLGGK